MIRFNGPNGEASEFSAKELEFFATPIGLKKIMLTSFLLYRIILNLRWQSAVLFAKHSLQVLLGMNPIDLDRTEYTKIIEGFIGFKPVSASGLYRIKINFSDGGMSFADIIVLYAQIVVADQYCLKKSNIRGKIAIDAGANQGIFSIFAARLGAAKVYAFEPVAPTYELLKKNIEANSLEGVVIPINKALADKPGRARIKYLYPGDGTAFIQQSEALSVQQPEGRRTSGLEREKLISLKWMLRDLRKKCCLAHRKQSKNTSQYFLFLHITRKKMHSAYPN